MSRTVVLNHGIVRGETDLKTARMMLKKQYAILMKLSKIYPRSKNLQAVIADANMLGLEVIDILEEVEEADAVSQA